jgi:hypothetical protein
MSDFLVTNRGTQLLNFLENNPNAFFGLKRPEFIPILQIIAEEGPIGPNEIVAEGIPEDVVTGAIISLSKRNAIEPL